MLPKAFMQQARRERRTRTGLFAVLEGIERTYGI